MKNLAQLEWYKPGCVFVTLRNSIIAIRQLYRSWEMSSRHYIDSALRPMALSSLRQNQKRANFIDQRDNAPADTAHLNVNFQVAYIILCLTDRLWHKTCLRLSY